MSPSSSSSSSSSDSLIIDIDGSSSSSRYDLDIVFEDMSKYEIEEVKTGKMDLSNLFERLKKLDD